MASFYASMAATSLRLLQKFGQSIVLARTTGEEIDPITGAVTAGTDASVTTTGVLLKYPDSMIDGTRILSSDRRMIISNEQVPQPSDKPTLNNQEWSIIGIETLSPAGTDVIYELQVRR